MGVRPTTPNPNRLIVEGIDDRHSVVGLMRAHVPWPANLDEVPVWIELGSSDSEIISALGVMIKAPDIRNLGVMLDADDDPHARYQQCYNACRPYFPAMPPSLPRTGLIIDSHEQRKRFGLWIMPNNEAPGDLETFLRFLVPELSEPLWQHAVNSFERARQLKCECRDSHIPKAHLYTWLAWQDPPGYSPGLALTRKILDPNAPQAAGFVQWFRSLYQL